MYCLRLLLVLLLFVKQEADLAIAVRKFVYQKDMSEYCRRRVMPSVFLGRQVIDAYSQILHFSRLELPYSCFVSIRTESGSNIILVIRLLSDQSLIDSCRESKNQLLVYEIGETFGGYWGALPDNVMKSELTTNENRYTLKTTQPTTTTTTTRRTTRQRTTASTTGKLEDEKVSTNPVDDIIVEVPLVNVSAILVPGNLPRDPLFDDEDPFDAMVDVKPKPGVSYKTKVLPLVQFAISDEVSGRRTSDGDEAGALRYEADLNADLFTPDARLSYPLLRLSPRSKQRGKYKYNVNSRLDFKKNKKLMAEKETLYRTFFRSQTPHEQPLFHSQSSDLLLNSKKETKHGSNPFEIVEAILKNLSKTKDQDPETNMKIDKDVADLLQGLAKIGPNESVFLVPNASWYTRRPASASRLISKKYRTDSITWRQPSASYRTNYLEEEDTSIAEGLLKDANKSFNSVQIMNNSDSVIVDVGRSGPLLPAALDVDRLILNVTQQKNDMEESIVNSKPDTLASEVSGTTTTATSPETTNYLEEEDTLNAEGLSQDANKSFNSMQTMNNSDSVIVDVGRSGTLLPAALDVNRVILNVTQQKNDMEESIVNSKPDTLASEVSGTTTTATSPETRTGMTSSSVNPMTLVDHESWENMVQAASLMAVMLNQSVTSSVDVEKQGLNVTLLPPSSNVMGRKKRFMHAIPIEHVKPHHLPVDIEVPSSTLHTDKISDAQEFQRLIELQDDEIHDRVALRYLRQYVGPALFNICDFEEATARHVYLFNSSRLVLAITNFTLERMTVVMTPARTLLTSDARCATAHLECQVSGARVCIDSLSACDGVPNCGSYDIYDEDHLTCGGSSGLQHNVCLAAITFLAVLLTILYTVHYWLKRCVPKVSDAFFIYTDAAENVLYLDPIMRSPHDTDDPKDMYRSAAMQEYMECTDMKIQKKTVGSFISRLSRFFRCNRKKKMSRILGDQIEEEYDVNMSMMDPGDRRFFSFAEVELRKMGSVFATDVAVQTGSSLEMQIMDKTIINERMTQVDSDSDIVAHYEGKRRSSDRRSILDLEMSSKEPSDELSILHFFRRARSVSMQMSTSHEVTNAENQAKYLLTAEKEVQSHEYDHSLTHETVSVLAATGAISDKKPEAGFVQKKLRFEEEMRTIHISDDDVAEEEVVTDQRIRRSVVYGGGKHAHLDETDSNSNCDEPSTSTGNREFKSYFWGSGKNKPKKPTKKKTQQLMR